MILFEAVQNAGLHRKMVNRVVDRVVTKIAGGKTAPYSRCRVAGDQIEQPVKCDRERNADRRGHYEPSGVVRIIVGNAVHDEMELFPAFGRRFVLKRGAMTHVL